MFIYTSTFLFCAILAITNLWKQRGQILLTAIVIIYLSLFIGFRYRIGVDWDTYQIIFLDKMRASLSDAIVEGDSAYSLINWLVARFGGQVWHVNLICAAIFSIGLVIFCRMLPKPGLALAVSVPILIIITAMGYTRQAAAVACVMLACFYFRGSLNWRWLGWLCLGVLFHKSAVIVFPAFMISASKNRILTIAISGSVLFATTVLVISRGLSDTLSLYFEGDIDSSGALPRVLIGVVAGFAFFLIKDRDDIFEARSKLFGIMAIMMIALLPIYFLIPSRTVVDRIGVLLLPFQSVAYAGLSQSIARRAPSFEILFSAIVIGCYGTLLLVWMTYATFSSYWIPYYNVLFMEWI